jgi:hypothetical protein
MDVRVQSNTCKMDKAFETVIKWNNKVGYINCTVLHVCVWSSNQREVLWVTESVRSMIMRTWAEYFMYGGNNVLNIPVAISAT